MTAYLVELSIKGGAYERVGIYTERETARIRAGSALVDAANNRGAVTIRGLEDINSYFVYAIARVTEVEVTPRSAE